MNKLQFFWRLLLDWLLTVMGVLGAMFCLITAFGLPRPGDLIPGVLLSAALSCCLLSEKKLRRFGVPALTALLALLCWIWHETLGESFRQLWGVLISRIALGYDRLLNLVPREPPEPGAVGPALACLGLVMALAVSCAVRWWRRSFPAALFLAPAIIPCFILLDTPPALLPLLAAAASVLIQAFSQSVRRRAAGEECKAICLAALLSAAILGLLLILFPREEYSPPISWNQLSDKMEDWSRAQNNRGNQEAGLTGDPEQVNLSTLGALPNHASTMLRIRAEQSDNLYLRGSAYSEFDGRSWARGEELDWDRSTILPYLGEEGGERLEISTEDPEPVLYTTYHLSTLPQGAREISDNQIPNPDGRTRYQFRYLRIWRGRSSVDALYDGWVRESCVQLPEQTRRAVLAWWDRQGGGEPPIRSGPRMVEFARQAAAAVSQCAVYSRNPLRTPDGVDFCDWFLNEAEEGYCVHFATACTALLRAMNIPARYVTGYVCHTVGGETVAVTTLQAHAWVEIWDEGRWIPIEPTPEDATEFAGQGMGGGEQPPVPDSSAPATEYPIPDDSRLPEPPESVPTRPLPTQEIPESTKPVGGDSPADPASPSKNLTPLWIFLGVIGLLALMLGRRSLARQLRERRLARASVNDRARLLYRYIRRLHSLGGGKIPEEVKRLAYKAGFSQYELSEEELACLRQLYDQQTARLQTAYFRRRFYCKYIRAVV